MFTFCLAVGANQPTKFSCGTYKEAVDYAQAILADLESANPDEYNAEITDPSGRLVWAQERSTYEESILPT